MKRSILLLVILIFCFSITVTGCTEDAKTEHLCVKCGGTATTTLSGPIEILQSNGISITDCTKVTSNVYSAHICDSCLGPVAEIKPDAGYAG